MVATGKRNVCLLSRMLKCLLLILAVSSPYTDGRNEPACDLYEHSDISIFPDKPLQLVKPDKQHKNLIIIKENVAFLQKILGPVAIVSVVGKFHSGKSFLMNQLMGKSNGFGIGPSVQPETMGIWMWGRPWLMRRTNGERLSVVFLDTEGFAANNVSENYDAKIFSVATLLSSYLLYNSVKIIDQADIDYLELLARRTQLFALRSQMSRSKWTGEFIHDLLSFPPLLWIVQDFVQTTVDKETSKEWLHRLMETHTRENEDYEIRLMDIFKSVDCHTLFLPATRKRILNDLSLATDDDLTFEYKEERDDLIYKLKQSLVPKEKNHKPITGAELATLFEILVNAANEGSLAEIPSRWNAFIERIKQTATEDCFKFYVAEMTAFSDKHNNKPVKAKDLQECHNQSFAKATKLIIQLLKGLEDALGDAKLKLTEDVSHYFEKTYELNEKKIKLRCAELQNQMELYAEEIIGNVQMPCPLTELQEHVNSVIVKVKTKFILELQDLIEPEIRDKYITSLNNMILNMADGLKLKNTQLIETTFQNEANIALEKFKELTNNDDNTPRKPIQLKKIVDENSIKAIDLFERHCIKLKEESLYTTFLDLLKGKISIFAKQLNERNEELVKDYIDRKSQELLKRFEKSTSPNHIQLPINASDLETRLRNEIYRIEREYKDFLDDFIVYDSYHSGLKDLLKLIDAVCKRREQENVDAFTQVVEKPLLQSKQIILLSADKYSTKFKLKNFMIEVCKVNLNDGKVQYWSSELKISIIEHFIQKDKELQKLLESKSGLWSSIIGFFQWLLWLIYLG
ncbi:guanylate-binding protein 2-like [Centruroides sculpturatus]|uniref:guanylate-binding protein 2-like n=1 Tax=Centruroides sculpturatus TaxID=218467 RepID=UPI000C6CA74A|nr:guanylate-binding protein 2-like [Centruroides sculpturatus]